MDAKEFLHQLQHERIVAAIQAAEAKTSGEIRVFVSRKLRPDALAALTGVPGIEEQVVVVLAERAAVKNELGDLEPFFHDLLALARRLDWTQLSELLRRTASARTTPLDAVPADERSTFTDKAPAVLSAPTRDRAGARPPSTTVIERDPTARARASTNGRLATMRWLWAAAGWARMISALLKMKRS